MLVSLPLLGRASLVEATSWIDAPLDGAVLPPAPYSVVAHSADQGGVAEVVFEVDGVRLRSLADGGELRLLTSRFLWVPTGLGSVRADGPGTQRGWRVGGAGKRNGRDLRDGDRARPDRRTRRVTGRIGLTRRLSHAWRNARARADRDARADLSARLHRRPTPRPTPTKEPTPAPTVLQPPVAILDNPVDFVELDFPSEATPLFEWHYSGGTGCIATQMLHIDDRSLGIDLATSIVGVGARTYHQRSALPWDPDNTRPMQCAHYHWRVRHTTPMVTASRARMDRSRSAN